MTVYLNNDIKKLNIRGLTADRLRTFYYVALTQNATIAGKKLGLSQSAVSKQIQSIEDDLSVILFTRNDKKFVLTPSGKRLYELAERVLHEIDLTLKAIQDEQETAQHCLRIYTFPTFASFMLPRLLEGFHEKNPNIYLQISTAYDGHQLNTGEILIDCRTPLNKNTQCLKLYDQIIGFFASTSYLEKHGTPKNLEDLDHHKLLALDRNLEKKFPMVNWALRVGLKGNLVTRSAWMYLNSNEALAQSIAEGLGVGALAKHHVQLMANPQIIHILPEWESSPLPFFFAFNSCVPHIENYMSLYDHISSQIGGLLQNPIL